MNIFHLLSFLAGVVVGSMMSILALLLCWKGRDPSTDEEWLFSAGVDAPLTTEILEERRSLSIFLDEPPTSSSDQPKSDTRSLLPSCEPGPAVSALQKALSTEMLVHPMKYWESCDPHSGHTDALDNERRVSSHEEGEHPRKEAEVGKDR